MINAEIEIINKSQIPKKRSCGNKTSYYTSILPDIPKDKSKALVLTFDDRKKLSSFCTSLRNSRQAKADGVKACYRGLKVFVWRE